VHINSLDNVVERVQYVHITGCYMTVQEIDARLESLRSGLTEIQSFDLTSDEEFPKMLLLAQLLLEISDQEMADALSVSRPTINRWTNKRNLPYLAMRKPVSTWISKRVAEKIRSLDALAHSFYAVAGA